MTIFCSRSSHGNSRWLTRPPVHVISGLLLLVSRWKYNITWFRINFCRFISYTPELKYFFESTTANSTICNSVGWVHFAAIFTIKYSTCVFEYCVAHGRYRLISKNVLRVVEWTCPKHSRFADNILQPN